MKKISFFIAALSLYAFSASAQSNNWRTKNIMLANWEIGTPLGSDFVKKTSLAGANVEFRHFVSPNFSVGAGIHWNTFEEYLSPRVYEKADGSGAVYTDIVPQVFVLPMLVKAHYYFDAGNKLKPYLGLGIGAQYSEQSLYYNIFVSSANNWGFAARPEAGLMYQLPNKKGGLHLNIGYNYATNENPDFKMESMSHLGYSIGGWWNLY